MSLLIKLQFWGNWLAVLILSISATIMCYGVDLTGISAAIFFRLLLANRYIPRSSSL
jgi:hypothetical protein